MTRSPVAAAALGALVCACTPGQVEQTAGAVAANQHIAQCADLQEAKEAIQPWLAELSQADRDRLRTINETHRVACTADLPALAEEVRAIRRDAR